MTEEVLTEVRDRMRRVETRLTRFLEEKGFDTGIQRPEWTQGVVTVPTPAVSLRDVLAVIPRRWPADQSVTVRCGSDVLLTVQVP